MVEITTAAKKRSFELSKSTVLRVHAVCSVPNNTLATQVCRPLQMYAVQSGIECSKLQVHNLNSTPSYAGALTLYGVCWRTGLQCIYITAAPLQCTDCWHTAEAYPSLPMLSNTALTCRCGALRPAATARTPPSYRVHLVTPIE